MRQPQLLTIAIVLALAGCNSPSSPSEPTKAAKATNTASDAKAPVASVAEPELIPRALLFGNPERGGVQISPDGKYLSWVAPVDGVQNVWVAPIDSPDKGRAVTSDKARGITQYFWSYRPDTLLYARDTGGDEDFHLFSVDLTNGASRDLTPYPKTRAVVNGVSHLHPNEVLVAMNDRDAQWHDVYRVDLESGKRTLVERNDDKIAGYQADADYKLRLALRAREDGGQDVLEPDGEGWKPREVIPFDDSMSTGYGGFTTDGKTVYLHESRERNTTALYAVELASGAKTLAFEDPRADISGGMYDPKTGVVQAVQSNYLREEWRALDDGISGDLKKLRELGPGVVNVNSRTLDDKTWIVAYAPRRRQRCSTATIAATAAS